MKENIIKKFECEICHAVYDKKESAIECEENHNKLEIIPIKRIILYNDCYSQIQVDFYPEARYRKEDDSIQLHTKYDYYGSEFTKSYWFHFDDIKVEYDKNDDNPNYMIYTKNLDKQYEKECIEKLIEYKISVLQNQINDLKNNKDKISYTEWK